jgi:predicted transglutaminase-like cysteine proteinase
MKDFKLKNIFRVAAFSGLAMMGMMSSCSTPDQKQLDTNPEPHLVISPASAQEYSDYEDWLGWSDRQNSYLTNKYNKVHYQAWLSRLDSAKNLPLLDQARIANDLVNNTVTYMKDRKNYGVSEYCASGVETILTGLGDCEDFAIAKFYALQYLGVPENRIAVMSVATDSASGDIDHGVLAVDTSAGNTWTNCLVLENQVDHEKVLSETGWKPYYLETPGKLRKCEMIIPTANKPKQPAL